jgi:putative oxidoreductase
MNILNKLHSDDLGKLLLRLAVGGLMLFHGVAKVQHGIGKIVQVVESKQLPGFLAYGIYVGEIVAPILILVGFLTRPAALIMCINMVFAIWLVHMADLRRITESGAWGVELQIFYLVGALALFFTGAGRFSISRGKGSLD